MLQTVGLIHGDIKPDNIMLVDQHQRPFKVKLVDFGLATDVSEVQQGCKMQHPYFRAPEVSLGLPITEAVDMWSLGCFMAAGVLGEYLFTGDSEYEVMRSIMLKLGMPSQSLLDAGSKSHELFIRDKRAWRLKNENPGPGTYGSIATAEVISPSFSVTGTGSFASKALRVPPNPQRGRPTPGPNAYNLQSSLVKNNLSRGASRAFRSPVGLQRDVPKDITPAPNQYDVHFAGPERNPIVAASSAFLSKTRRSYFSSPNTVKVPSPCHYEVKETVIQKCPRVAMSPFKSKTPRLPPTQDSLVPGPGAYNPHQVPAPVKRTIMPRRHYLTLSAPPLIVRKSPLLPGPGQYDLVNYDGPPKHLMSSAVFVSHTRRMIQEKQGQGGPGPGFYEPQTPSKRSFLYNHSKIWIPT